MADLLLTAELVLRNRRHRLGDRVNCGCWGSGPLLTSIGEVPSQLDKGVLGLGLSFSETAGPCMRQVLELLLGSALLLGLEVGENLTLTKLRTRQRDPVTGLSPQLLIVSIASPRTCVASAPPLSDSLDERVEVEAPPLARPAS